MTTPAGFMVIAHRGASEYAPENTLAAFDLAVRMGARHTELDVRATRDGQVVVLHDETLDRTTNGSGPVAERGWDEVRALDAGAWFGPEFAGEHVPAFADILGRYRGVLHLHIEIKGRTPGLTQKTLDLVEQHGMGGEATMTSFQKERLEEVRRLAPGLPTGYLTREADAEAVAWAKAQGVAMLCPKAGSLTPDAVQRLHAQGFLVRAYGVRDEGEMRRVIECGADGMTVNFPDKALALLGQEPSAPQ